jgi:hypothetical protein
VQHGRERVALMLCTHLVECRDALRLRDVANLRTKIPQSIQAPPPPPRAHASTLAGGTDETETLSLA